MGKKVRAVVGPSFYFVSFTAIKPLGLVDMQSFNVSLLLVCISWSTNSRAAGIIIYSYFNDKMSNIVNVVRRENKTCYLLGDYDINILNYENNAQTPQFVDMISSNGFLPLITRPSRVTATSATSIDNIFTNNIGDMNNSVEGLFITDISDHFPVFHIARQMEIK